MWILTKSLFKWRLAESVCTVEFSASDVRKWTTMYTHGEETRRTSGEFEGRVCSEYRPHDSASVRPVSKDMKRNGIAGVFRVADESVHHLSSQGWATAAVSRPYGCAHLKVARSVASSHRVNCFRPWRGWSFHVKKLSSWKVCWFKSQRRWGRRSKCRFATYWKPPAPQWHSTTFNRLNQNLNHNTAHKSWPSAWLWHFLRQVSYIKSGCYF